MNKEETVGFPPRTKLHILNSVPSYIQSSKYYSPFRSMGFLLWPLILITENNNENYDKMYEH